MTHAIDLTLRERRRLPVTRPAPISHAIKIDTVPVDDACAAHGMTYRGRVGPWQLIVRPARVGGARHVAAMERGKR